MAFEVGQKVVFLNEKGGGVITRIESSEIYLTDENGFEKRCLADNLAAIHSEDYKLSNFNPTEEEIATSIEATETIRTSTVSGRKKDIVVWEVDLHAEEILESQVGMTNHEILTKQISVFKSLLAQARSKHIRKLIVIHGVGQGVLKSELSDVLKKESDLEYYDADYREYGKGATEITLYSV